LVVIAPALVGPQGDSIVDALIDVPVIQCGAERRLRAAAIAAAQ
jgi:hypothetical protein